MCRLHCIFLEQPLLVKYFWKKHSLRHPCFKYHLSNFFFSFLSCSCVCVGGKLRIQLAGVFLFQKHGLDSKLCKTFHKEPFSFTLLKGWCLWPELYCLYNVCILKIFTSRCLHSSLHTIYSVDIHHSSCILCKFLDKLGFSENTGKGKWKDDVICWFVFNY